MDRSVVVYLIANTKVKNSLGIWEDATTERQVFADVTSISQSEWFEGGRAGLNPALRFRMFAPDYQGEATLRYEDTVYAIYRTYVDRNEIIDLYTEVKKGI